MQALNFARKWSQNFYSLRHLTSKQNKISSTLCAIANCWKVYQWMPKYQTCFCATILWLLWSLNGKNLSSIQINGQCLQIMRFRISGEWIVKIEWMWWTYKKSKDLEYFHQLLKLNLPFCIIWGSKNCQWINFFIWYRMKLNVRACWVVILIISFNFHAIITAKNILFC